MRSITSAGETSQQTVVTKRGGRPTTEAAISSVGRRLRSPTYASCCLVVRTTSSRLALHPHGALQLQTCLLPNDGSRPWRHQGRKTKQGGPSKFKRLGLSLRS